MKIVYPVKNPEDTMSKIGMSNLFREAGCMRHASLSGGSRY